MRVPLCLAATLLISVSAVAAAGAPAPMQGGGTPERQASTPAHATAVIPGPLRSFLRMAGISQKVAPDEVLPLLAQNVVIRGYRGWGNDSQPTEYMTLLRRYVQQARELRNIAAASGGTIRVENCEQAQPVLAVLGYKFHASCGQDVVLETADAQRAFLTLDSGFPLTALEQALAEKKPFAYEYPSSALPVLFTQEDWTNVRGAYAGHRGDVIDALLVDPMLSRVYWAFARMDDQTRGYLRQSVGIAKLLRYAPVFDFYSTQLLVRSGRVMVPGGAAAEPVWQELVGSPVTNPAEFIVNLMAKDQGWLAAYFDSLSRATAEQQKYFVEPRRLKQFYQALLGKDANPSPARPVFRSDPGMLLLINSLQFTKDGQPLVPGGLAVWNEIAHQKGQSPQVQKLAKRVGKWSTPDEMVAGMFTFSRGDAPDNPLQFYLTISEIERGRKSQPLAPQTVRLLAARYARFGQQYTDFTEFPDLDNNSIARFINIADGIDRIHDHSLRSDTLGVFQANVGLWQILARQGQIPREQFSDSFQRTLAPFAGIRNSAQLFDSGRTALHAILRAATNRDRLSQDEIVSLLAGPNQRSSDAEQVHEELARNIQSVLQDQRLISLDTLWDLADGMKELAAGKPVADSLMPLARELREFEFPRPLFTKGERVQYAPSLPDSRHAESQTHIDLTPVLKSANPKLLAEARGQLTPFLRDSLVGLNYAYYEPPGAQMLHHNPLFVRSHDFSGTVSPTGEYSWQTPQLFGSCVAAGRGAHLMGSLADLPYVLSEVEEDFIVPENVQALIWQELVPVLVTSAILPRWWNISADEMHAVALYQKTGEELLDAAAKDAHVRQNVMSVLSDRVLMQRREQLEQALASGHAEAPPQMLPGEAFYLAAEYRRRFAGENTAWGAAGSELDALSRSNSKDTDPERISRDFGVPHPVLRQTYSRELSTVKPFPALMGYGSRLLAETWDSGNLYWARLADEMHIPPVQLNRLVPTLTRRMVEKIFATDFEDLPALTRAMEEAGDEFRHRRPEPATAGVPLTPQPATSNYNPQP
jgi:hypothetical protein